MAYTPHLQEAGFWGIGLTIGLKLLNTKLGFGRVKQPRKPRPTQVRLNAKRGIGTHRVGLGSEIASPSITVIQKVRGADASIAVENCRSGRGAEHPPTLVKKAAVGNSTHVVRWTWFRFAGQTGGRINAIRDNRIFRTFVVLCLLVCCHA